MKSFVIMNKVFKELVRDKRTLVLMFVAPILILFMLNLMFTSNNNVYTSIGTVNLSPNIKEKLNDIKYTKTKSYASFKTAKQAMKSQKIDSIVKQSGKKFDIIYENIDSSKTIKAKSSLKEAFTIAEIAQLKTVSKINTDQNKNKININNHYVYGNKDTGFFAKMIPILIGFFVFFFVFLISGMALLKERTSGTLDRLLATPIKRYEIVFGYMLSYGILAILQTFVIVISSIYILNLEIVGSVVNIIIVNVILAFVALSFGILMSTFAQSEFQMMQFIPIIIIPQIFFSGLIPVDTMADWVKYISYILPIKYSGDAQTQIIMNGAPIEKIWFDLFILIIFGIALTFLNIIGLKKYRKV
ncbi:ABC transporter permease [Companilactobacillus sp. DQM5]|uniref:ABC transporter permease n=1 Tax=Companilactobacillus sp. DQM5 TaxID=3463359 RepID=UPI00405A2780